MSARRSGTEAGTVGSQGRPCQGSRRAPAPPPRRPSRRAPGGKRRIGVYVCHCGGNISDYVDVDKVVASLEGDPDVVVAKTAMFTCSDASQQEIIEDIQEQKLDGIVVASCSPKLHTFTFRDVAKRAGLSPFQYTQVNIREQCSWTHTDDHEGATRKAAQLVKAGVGRTRLTVPARTRSSSRPSPRPWWSGAASPV